MACVSYYFNNHNRILGNYIKYLRYYHWFLWYKKFLIVRTLCRCNLHKHTSVLMLFVNHLLSEKGAWNTIELEIPCSGGLQLTLQLLELSDMQSTAVLGKKKKNFISCKIWISNSRLWFKLFQLIFPILGKIFILFVSLVKPCFSFCWILPCVALFASCFQASNHKHSIWLGSRVVIM